MILIRLVISWRAVLLVEDPEKNYRWSQVTDKLYHIILYLALIEIRTHISGDRHCRVIAYVILYPTTIQSRPRQPLLFVWFFFSFFNETISVIRLRTKTYQKHKCDLLLPRVVCYVTRTDT